MLAGLNALELGRLRMSVGYGRQKKGRPLSPVEVGLLLRKARDEGNNSLRDCAEAVRLDGTGHIGRFLHILKLPEDVRHLVDWGAGKGFIGFTSAVELAKFRDPGDQRTVAESILSKRLNSREVRQVAQLRKRSGRPVEECVDEVLGMRTTVERRYVFIGSVAEEDVARLGGLTQTDKDSVLKSGIERFNLRGATGRLGTRFFTLVGDERFNASMLDVGKENIETLLRTHISETVNNGASGR